MAGPIAVDTPDYQRGVVSAQKLLATVAAGTDHVTVGIPPNAESIIVTADSFSIPPVVYCEGVSTLYKYDGVHGPQKTLIMVADTWAFDVSYPMDQQVTVQFSEAPSDQWYVYADSAARVQFDGSGRYDNEGNQFVIPTVPNTQAGDHPAIELSLASGSLTGSGNMIAAPGAGQRVRVFALQMMGNNSGGLAYAENGNNGTALLSCRGLVSATMQIPLTGFPLSTNTPLWMAVAAFGADFSAYYTVEAV